MVSRVIIELTQSSWAGAGTELGKTNKTKECTYPLQLSDPTKGLLNEDDLSFFIDGRWPQFSITNLAFLAKA